MNQANTLCLVALIIIMASLAKILCFGLNPDHLGGLGPAGLMVAVPVVSYMLGRGWISD